MHFFMPKRERLRSRERERERERIPNKKVEMFGFSSGYTKIAVSGIFGRK